MSELRAEAFDLVREIPEERLENFLSIIKNFLKSDETLAEKNLKWLAEPDKYENEINECISEVIKEVRRENAHNH